MSRGKKKVRFSDGSGSEVGEPIPSNTTEEMEFYSLPSTMEIETDWSSKHSQAPKCIEHIPGVTDLMSGGLSPQAQPLSIPLNDGLDCSSDIDAQFNHMPWRVLTSETLSEIPNLFNDPVTSRHILGERFLTTNAGLYRAYRECEHTSLTGRDRDYLVIGALARRGGTVMCGHNGRTVLYSEQIDPLLATEPSLLDSLYWEALHARRVFWKDAWRWYIGRPPSE